MEETDMDIKIRPVTIDDYDAIYELWEHTEQTRRALNPVDDSKDGIERYLKRNPSTCFLAIKGDQVIGIILSGHDGRRGLIHHLCVHQDHRHEGIAAALLEKAEKALQKEGISKVFCVVFTDNDVANAFWQSQGYTVRSNINYRNKSLNKDVPQGE